MTGVGIELSRRRCAWMVVGQAAACAVGLLSLVGCGEVLTDQTMKLLVALELTRTGAAGGVVAVEDVQIVGNCPAGLLRMRDDEVCREFRIEQHDQASGLAGRADKRLVMVWFGKLDGIWKVDGSRLVPTTSAN